MRRPCYRNASALDFKSTIQKLKLDFIDQDEAKKWQNDLNRVFQNLAKTNYEDFMVNNTFTL